MGQPLWTHAELHVAGQRAGRGYHLNLPVVAPVGTVVVISEAETTVNVAAVPLNVTLVAPVKFVPRILTAVPTFQHTNGTFAPSRRFLPAGFVEPHSSA